jgi:hypothetical protein
MLIKFYGDGFVFVDCNPKETSKTKIYKAMIITEILLAVSTPISAFIVKCVKDEIDRLHAHLIEQVEELEKQLAHANRA